MNALQTMLATANTQARPINQEEVVINSAKLYGTFGDPQVMPVMTRAGYQDHLVNTLKVSRDQFSSDPVAKTTITRPATGRKFFVQVVDYTNPVVYTFILTDREL